MLPIEKQKTIDGFYEEIKDQFPYSREQVSEAIRSFFNYIKVSMKDPELPEIRVKYFGHFFVKTGKVQAVLRQHLSGMFTGKDSEYADLVKYRVGFLTRYLHKHAPEKLIIPDSFFQRRSVSEKYILLPSGEFEVQIVLCEKPSAEVVVEETHQGTDQFPDFLHGLNMLYRGSM